MGSTSQRACLGSSGLYSIAMLLYVIGFSCPYWIYVDDEGPSATETRSGLWKTCTKVFDSGWNCWRHDISEQEGWFKTVIAFMIMGLIVASLAGARVYMSVSAGMEITAGIFGTVGVCVYGTKSEVELEELGWAYWVTVSGVALFLINGCILAVLTAKVGACNLQRQMPNQADPV